MRALLIGKDEIDALVAVRQFAEANPFAADDIHDAVPAAGNRCVVPMGFGVTFTVEVQPVGRMRHLSVIIRESGRVANLLALRLIGTHLGMTIDPDDPSGRLVWFEEVAGGFSAIHVLERDEEPKKRVDVPKWAADAVRRRRR